MLDLDLVAVFSVITAGFWCRLSEKKKKKKKKKTIGEVRATTTKKAKAISWK